MLLQKFLGGHACFQGDQLVSLGFESADDVSDNTSLNSIRFDLEKEYNESLFQEKVNTVDHVTYHDVSSFHCHRKRLSRARNGDEGGLRHKGRDRGNNQKG